MTREEKLRAAIVDHDAGVTVEEQLDAVLRLIAAGYALRDWEALSAFDEEQPE